MQQPLSSFTFVSLIRFMFVFDPLDALLHPIIAVTKNGKELIS